MSPIALEDTLEYFSLSALSIPQVLVCLADFFNSFGGGVWQSVFVVTAIVFFGL